MQKTLLTFVDNLCEDLELWVKGKRATGSLGIKDDLGNAGATWINQPVVLDGNLISSRTPVDLAPFARAMAAFLGGERGREGHF